MSCANTEQKHGWPIALGLRSLGNLEPKSATFRSLTDSISRTQAAACTLKTPLRLQGHRLKRCINMLFRARRLHGKQGRAVINLGAQSSLHVSPNTASLRCNLCRWCSLIILQNDVGSLQVSGILTTVFAWKGINRIYIRYETGVATTRWPEAVMCNIACRWTWIGRIYGEDGKGERGDRDLLILAHVVVIAIVPVRSPIYPVKH